jgi:hypothetical protein
MINGANLLMRQSCGLIVSVGLVGLAPVALAQSVDGPSAPPGDGASTSSSAFSAPNPSTTSFSDGPELLSATPKTLTAQKLHGAVLPAEAEIRCAYWEPCALGLTRGFAVGSDAIAALTSLLVRPQVQPGGWLYLDGFVSFQFLNGIENTFYANGSFGYRTSRFRDSSNNEIESGGFFGRFNYAQDISSLYTQGVTLSGVLSPWYRVNSRERLYLNQERGRDARRSLEDFYGASHRTPTLWLSFPGDFEVVNWKGSHIDLPQDLHGYAHVEPFFAQNEFRIGDEFLWVERNYGTRAGVTMSYESSPERVAQRFALSATLGVEAALSYNIKDTATPAERGVEFLLPERSQFSPYADLMASWQF